MTEAEWRDGTDPHEMLRTLRRRKNSRKLRLFAVACCRRLWHLFTDSRSQRAVDTVESWAEGRASRGDVEAVHADACAASDEAWEMRRRRYPEDVARVLALAVDNAADLAGNTASWAVQAAGHAAWMEAMGRGRGFQRRAREAAWRDEARAQADLLRCVFGNPFRPFAFDPAWRTVAAVAVSHAVYEGRRFEELPVLADALEEAGCTSAELLAHLRGPGPHAKGCWALDAALAKG